MNDKKFDVVETETKDVQQEERVNYIKEKLKGKSLFIGMPLYGGMGFAENQTNVMSVINLGTKLGIPVRYQPLLGESLVQRARNMLVQLFYDSEFTHMLFWDGDVVFENPMDVFIMLAFCGEDTLESKEQMDIICAAYPKKVLAWDKVLIAAKSGLCDDNPERLADFACDYVVNFAHGSTSVNLHKPIQIKEGGTGAMIFGRGVIEKHRKKFPNKKYTPDHRRSKEFNGDKPTYALFDCCIDEESNRYLSEDYFFSRESEKIGLKTFLLPWVKTFHIGQYKYKGDFEAMLKLLNVAKNDYNIALSGPISKRQNQNNEGY